MQVRFKAKMQDGKFLFHESKRFKEHCSNLEGHEIAITVSKWRKSRSTNQNSYYWGVVIEILSREFGYSQDEMHSTLKSLFLVDHSGKIPRVKSTANLNTAEFEDYLTKVRNWASIEHNIFLPLPNEVEF